MIIIPIKSSLTLLNDNSSSLHKRNFSCIISKISIRKIADITIRHVYDDILLHFTAQKGFEVKCKASVSQDIQDII